MYSSLEVPEVLIFADHHANAAQYDSFEEN